jgi:hypothetical protein
MRILLGTHQLEQRAGSELFTTELATVLRERGHDVAIFTFFKGMMAAEVEAAGVPVFDAADADAIVQFMPDIVQTSHIPCAHFLRAVVPGRPRLHAMLGVIPHLEAPPLDGRAFSLGLAASEEVRDRAMRTSFGQDTEIAVFRNWFDERAVSHAKPRPAGTPPHVAVISHHVASPLAKALTSLEATGKLKADYFGSEHRTVVVDGALLTRYDAVISIGRTPLLAAACGVPCIMADTHGSDGLLTADNLDDVRTCNFSGRFARTPITQTHLEHELSRIAAYDREALRQRMVADYALGSRVDWLLARYEIVLAQHRKNPVEQGQLPAPSEGLVHAELVARIQILKREVAELQKSGWHRATQFVRRTMFGRLKPQGRA